MDKKDLKEKLILISVTTGIFLPVRILFSAYVTEHWIGSVGFVSLLGILFVILIKYNKLGKFGEIFERQMRKTIGGKTGKYVIGFSILFLVYFGSSLYFMDRGDTVYFEDKEIFFSSIVIEKNVSIDNIPFEKLNGPQPIFGDNPSLAWVSNLDYSLSIAFAMMDDASEGWLGHLVVVIFVEQIEVLGLLYFYRKTFKQRVPIEKKS